MWWWIWTALVLLALVITLALCWRVFLAVKALIVAIGESAADVDRAGGEAEQRHQAWLAEQRLTDEAYVAARTEAARPALHGLQPLPRVSSKSPPREAP